MCVFGGFVYFGNGTLKSNRIRHKIVCKLVKQALLSDVSAYVSDLSLG